jgi:2,4-dienoyl-CoA reductase-like NADH-dependent reductase (Old Yellow Enzyme family)
MPALTDPLTLASGLTLRNRIVKPAMTENLADRDNQPTPALERLYARWAAGGVGMLITGNLMVDRRYLERSRNVVADALVDPDRLAALAQAANGVPLLAQLSHPGRQTNRLVHGRPVAPSAGERVALLGAFARPRALTGTEIDETVARFVDAAVHCRDAGFDGVQVHAAHGYLLAQFLSPAVNQRTDEWGGDVAGRARLLLRIVREIRAATGPGFTLAVKLNSSDFRRGGFHEDDAARVAVMLDAAGIDLLEISGGTYESLALLGLAAGQQPTGADREAYFAGFATRIRSQVDAPVMLTGGIRSRAAMDALLGGGTADVLGLARPLAIDPDLPGKLLRGDVDAVELPPNPARGVLRITGESEWYERQLSRLAAGLPADLGLGHTRAGLEYVVAEAGRALPVRWRRRRLAREAGRRVVPATT